jgi:hypothetical protein
MASPPSKTTVRDESRLPTGKFIGLRLPTAEVVAVPPESSPVLLLPANQEEKATKPRPTKSSGLFEEEEIVLLEKPRHTPSGSSPSLQAQAFEAKEMRVALAPPPQEEGNAIFPDIPKEQDELPYEIAHRQAAISSQTQAFSSAPTRHLSIEMEENDTSDELPRSHTLETRIHDTDSFSLAALHLSEEEELSARKEEEILGEAAKTEIPSQEASASQGGQGEGIALEKNAQASLLETTLLASMDDALLSSMDALLASMDVATLSSADALLAARDARTLSSVDTLLASKDLTMLSSADEEIPVMDLPRQPLSKVLIRTDSADEEIPIVDLASADDEIPTVEAAQATHDDLESVLPLVPVFSAHSTLELPPRLGRVAMEEPPSPAYSTLDLPPSQAYSTLGQPFSQGSSMLDLPFSQGSSTLDLPHSQARRSVYTDEVSRQTLDLPLGEGSARILDLLGVDEATRQGNPLPLEEVTRQTLDLPLGETTRKTLELSFGIHQAQDAKRLHDDPSQTLDLPMGASPVFTVDDLPMYEGTSADDEIPVVDGEEAVTMRISGEMELPWFPSNENTTESKLLKVQRLASPSEETLAAPLGSSAISGEHGSVEVILEELARHCGRACCFLVKEGALIGIAAKGEGEVDRYIGDILLPLDAPSLYASVIRARSSYAGSPALGALDRILMACLGEQEPKEVALFPILQRDQVVALYYLDDAGMGRFPEDTHGLELILRRAESIAYPWSFDDLAALPNEIE